MSYQKIMAKKAKALNIKPLKILSHHDTVYLHACFARTPGKPFKEGKAFEVEVEFTGKPVEYVAERTWTADQRKRIIDLEDGKIRLDLSEIGVFYVIYVKRLAVSPANPRG